MSGTWEWSSVYLADSWRCPFPWFTLLDRQSQGKIERMINVSLGFPAMIFSFEQNTDDVSYLASPNQHRTGANLEEIAKTSPTQKFRT